MVTQRLAKLVWFVPERVDIKIILFLPVMFFSKMLWSASSYRCTQSSGLSACAFLALHRFQMPLIWQLCKMSWLNLLVLKINYAFLFKDHQVKIWLDIWSNVCQTSLRNSWISQTASSASAETKEDLRGLPWRVWRAKECGFADAFPASMHCSGAEHDKVIAVETSAADVLISGDVLAMR